ncbi:MAG TPA: ATP-binding protein, partial [Verrucomicrobiae bacterium]|nr:ATP-binding protein [Verrucomicrobiae bacterium]
IDSMIEVMVPDEAGRPLATNLVDAAVEVHGVCTTKFNDHRRLQGVALQVPDWNQIEIKEAAPEDPFKLPLRPIAELYQFQSGSARLHRVHVQGTIVRRQNDGSFFVQDRHDGVYVRCRGPARQWTVGSAVEVVGFAGLTDQLPSLHDALVRTAAGRVPVEVTRINPESALNEERHATLVQIRGRVIGHSARGHEEVLTMQAGEHVFDAVLERKGEQTALARLGEGSVLELTGIYVALLDNQGQPRSFQLLLRSPADANVITRPSWWTIWHTAAVLGATGAVLLMALAWAGLLRRQVQQRTQELRAEIEERKRAEEELKKAQGDLLRASRLAGMAEVATSVLHNVGNVLNSVNVSINVVFDQVKGSKIANVAKVAGLMREHASDLPEYLAKDPKGRQLPPYLGQLSEHLAREQGALLNELELLRKNAGHIKDIVATQQSYAKVVGVTETIKVTDLVEDALRVNMEALARHDVRLVREFASELPAISVDKHKVLQILVNLIRNAKHACDDAGHADKRLTVRVANGDGRLKISVSDNGVGIASENLTRIFNHGFTTRKNGHGFGLHSGALAAKELGGALLAKSDGPGKGATFTLELPVGNKN